MKEKRDILFLCQFFYPEYVSSATLPFDTAQALSNSGKSVGVLCGYPKEYNNSDNIPLRENIEGIEIERLKYIQMNRSNIIGRLINYFSFTLSVLLRISKIKNYKSVIVYSNPPVLPAVAALANKFFGTKVVFVSYDLYPEIAIRTKAIKSGSIIHKIMNYINNFSYPRFTKIVSLSNEMSSFILANRKSVNAKDIEVIPNWHQETAGNEILVESSDMNPLFINLPVKDKVIISYFGNMGIAQDMKTIIDVIISNSNNLDVHFILGGHGNKKESLKEIIIENQIDNVTLFDFLKGKDYQDALSISDALIVSLEKNLAGLCVPSKTYSYYAAGKPIIAILDSEMDISKEIIEAESGFVIKNGDIKAFNNIIDELRDPIKRDKMGQQSKKIFNDNYTQKKCTDMYIRLINEMLED